MLRKLGYAENDVTLVAAGGFPQSLTLLETGAVNVAVITEPTISTNNGKYRTVIAGWDASIFPATTSTLGISPIKMIKERPQFIRGVIAGRRLAVDYMASHRDEAAALIGAANKLETPVVRSMLDRLIDQGTSEGVPVFATGRIYPNALENTIQMLRTIGAVQGEVDLAKMIDESLLPDDQKSTKK